jgi:hypothetical protein
VLQALTLSSWIAALLFTASVAVLLQFRRQRSTDILNALQELAARPVTTFVIVVVALTIVTIVTQVFSVDAIKTLEGYWGRSKLAGLASRLMIQRHVRKKDLIFERLRRATKDAVNSAKPRMLRDGIPDPVADALEATVLGKKLPPFSDEDRLTFRDTDWRQWCESWRLVRIDNLLTDVKAYPDLSRIMPTKLGNIMRATEDRLVHWGGDEAIFILQRRGVVSPQVQMRHDQFRNRLELYCTLVFVSASLALLTPIMLFGYLSLIPTAVISVIFAALSAASYHAAIASAEGYCTTLRQMDRVQDV